MGLISRVSSRTYRKKQTKKHQHKKMCAPTGEYVQVYGRKKTASAVALCKKGNGLIKVNGRPLDKIEPEALRLKLQEPVFVVGEERFKGVDIKIKVSGGGRVARSTPSVRLSAKPSSLTTKNSSTNTPKLS